MKTRRINPASLRNLHAYIRDLPKTIKKRGDPAIREGAELFATKLREAITSQKYASNYVQLSGDYLMRKIRYANTSDYPAFWMFDEELVNAITVVRRSTAGHSGSPNMSYVVGFNNDPHSSRLNNAEITNAELAKMLEEGYGRIPARPVIQPTWDEFGSAIREHVRKIFNLEKNRYERYKIK